MFRYTGRDGAHYIGIPARDLSAAEFAALDKEQQAAVRSGALYEPVDPPKEETPKEEPKEETPKGKK